MSHPAKETHRAPSRKRCEHRPCGQKESRRALQDPAAFLQFVKPVLSMVSAVRS